MKQILDLARGRSLPAGSEDIRTGLSPAALAQAVADNLHYVQARVPEIATRNDWYLALACTVRDRLLDRWIKTVQGMLTSKDLKVVCYLSAEFLMGPQLGNSLINLGIYDPAREAVGRLKLDLDELLAQEEEPGLGNGGLGRLAACFMDSLSTLEVPAIGYGIRYEFGIFDQEIHDGWQLEVTDQWLRLGNPWEIAQPGIRFDVSFGGHTESYRDAGGQYRVRWIPDYVVQGTPYDTAMLGFGMETANVLRLWKAEAKRSFDFRLFNAGDYYGAVHDKVDSENITKVLYPNDEPAQGRELRLKQQYFFVSCSLQDMIRIYLQREQSLEGFNKKFAIQLNDTHPSIAIPELMRLLVDENLMDWDTAWDITQRAFGYTNHTLLSEALERWPVGLIGRLLPRHLEIIYEINRRFLDQVRVQFPGDDGKVGRLSLIDETGERYVRMANLACVGSHAINGVSELHTHLLEEEVLPDFFDVMRHKFSNKTNGISHRRFLMLANAGLARLI